MAGSPSRLWTPPPRPDWLARVLEESRYMNLAAMVPLDADGLIAAAVSHTGLDDFGSDDWREPFAVICRSLDEEAGLHLFGRLMTRNELFNLLVARLRIEDAYRRHPEIEDQVIDAPVVVTGLGRSGTSILYELLSQDRRFAAPESWEAMFPCPPPEAAGYDSDPRIPVAHHFLTQWGRVGPDWNAMHESGGRIPAECVAVYEPSFRSDNLPSKVPLPSYAAWLATADMTPALAYEKRILKLLQWKNPRRHWLLKSPSHLAYLPTLFKVFPDARVVVTHRDPIMAQASITNMLGTLYWMRSDRPFDAGAFEALMTAEATAQRLNQLGAWLDAGAVPGGQVHAARFADLVQRPLEMLAGLYADMGLDLDEPTRDAMARYLQHKPRGKFGVHRYDVGQREEIARQRAIYRPYQERFAVPSEAEA